MSSGWVVNTALTELTPEMAENAMNGKIRKDLKAAFELAAEKHPIDYFKQILQQFEDDRIAQEEAAKAAAPYVHARLAHIETKAEARVSFVARCAEAAVS